MKRSIASLAFAFLVVTLVGCAGGDGPPGGGVKGSVLWEDGKPAAGVLLLVGGQQVPVNAQGQFEAKSVATPYDIAAYLPDAGGPGTDVAFVIEGVSRRDPVLVLPEMGLPQARTADLSVWDIDYEAPPAAPAGSVNTARVFCSGAAGEQVFCSGPELNDGIPKDFSAQWSGPAQLNARVWAFRGTESAAYPWLYTGFQGFADGGLMTLQDGGTASLLLQFHPVTTGTVTGNVVLPAGFTLERLALELRFGNASLGEISFRDSSSGPIPAGFALAAPVLTGTGYGLYLHASASNGPAQSYLNHVAVEADSSGVVLKLRDPPVQSSPANGALGVQASQTFKWTAPPGGIQLVTFRPLDPDTPGYIIGTSGSEVRLPDLSPLGVEFPRASHFQWVVGSADLGQAGSVDDLLGGVPLDQVGEGYTTTSQEWTFTTAP